jgi:hypothetical protein
MAAISSHLPPGAASAHRDRTAHVAVLLDMEHDDAPVIDAASRMCLGGNVRMRIVHLPRPVALWSSPELPYDWIAAQEHELRQSRWLHGVCAAAPSGVPVEHVTLPAVGLRSGALMRVLREAGAVVVPCRCRSALRHRRSCRAAYLARRLDVRVVAVKTLAG